MNRIFYLILLILSLNESNILRLLSFSVGGVKFEKISFILIFLTALISLIITLRGQGFSSSLNKLINLILFSLVLVFLSNRPILFYFTFEFSLVPIILIIIGWGYQPERLPAAYALSLYTITASLPLIVITLYLINEGESSFILLNKLCLITRNFSFLFIIILIVGFIVKFPIFRVHLWLPKAHVEAPVVGSMVLAAILLKLGGYGQWQFQKLIRNNMFNDLIQALSIRGGALIAILCVLQTDIKVLIAYSSVAHIRFVIAAIRSQSTLSYFAAWGLIISHGVSSSAIFAGANIIYLSTNSRNLLLTSGLLNLLPYFTLCWLLSRLGNIGAPPTINLISEIWCINSLIPHRIFLFIPIFITRFFGAAYTLVLYASTQQGNVSRYPSFNIINISWLKIIRLHIVWLVMGIVLIFYCNFSD